MVNKALSKETKSQVNTLIKQLREALTKETDEEVAQELLFMHHAKALEFAAKEIKYSLKYK